MRYTAKKVKRGGGIDYDNFVNAMVKLKSDVQKLGNIISQIKNSQQNNITATGINVPEIDNSNSTPEVVPDDIQDKIEQEQDEMDKLLENVDDEEKKLEEEPSEENNKNDANDSSTKENLDESKEELEKNIDLLKEKIDEGLPNKRPPLQKTERNRSFYSSGRTWSQWFYGFVEYYDELKGTLTDIIENSYYAKILSKPKNQRTKTENDMIEKVNDLEIELSNMNKKIIQGGRNRYRIKTKTRKYKRVKTK
jgi:hypothetical protein